MTAAKRRASEGRIVGGCPCGWWAIANCRYIRAVRMCLVAVCDRPELPAAPATRTADDVFERPPWCGTCDEWTRKVEVEIDGRDAMQNCGRCHPLAVAS